MQTGTAKGMQTMEQSLAELTLRRVITVETALGRCSRPEQLIGLLERSGFELPESLTQTPGQQAAGLRIAAEA
jgi:Tfp pilus assembly ATPase PilU